MKFAVGLCFLLLSACASAEESNVPVQPTVATPAQSDSPDNIVKNRTWAVSAVRKYCKNHDLAITEYGDGPVRLLLIGKVTIPDPMNEVIVPAELALDGLETWTGQQEQFRKHAMPQEECYNLCIFAEDDDFIGFINSITRAGQSGLSKYTLNTTFPRCAVCASSRSLPLLRWWSVYASSSLAINSYFLERGVTKPPTWLREGLCAELQRRVCGNKVRCYTISYEESHSDMNGDWSKDVAEMVAQKSTMMRSAGDVMLMDTIKLPGEYYKQMWSLASYVTAQAHNQSGGDNKLMKLFSSLAAGTPSARAIKAVFGKEDPSLTNAWRGWVRLRR
jgi:hypothetical protein